MSSTSYEHRDGDDYVTEVVDTGTQTAEIRGPIPYRQFRVSVDDGQVRNDGADTETVTVEIVDGLEVARGTDPTDASVLPVDATARVNIDGAEVSVSLTGGSGTRDVTTTKARGRQSRPKPWTWTLDRRSLIPPASR